MATELYRSYSLEKSKNENNEVITSGSLTLWKDTPVSPFDVGDTFRPVTSSPVLTVEKVSIKDNVVGMLNGKPVRQWEVTVEGSDETSASSTTHVKYNFNIASDEKSGTMEVTNIGETPSVTIQLGANFTVPGIGQVKCVNVKGNDEYDDNGNHIWTVVYEGSDKTETLPPTSYNLSFERDSSGELQKTGRMQVVQTGATPPSTIQVGSTFNVPGVGNLTCTKVSGNDDYTETGTHRWTMVYEGVLGSSDNPDDPDTPTANAKYTFSKERDAQGNTTQSGTVEISNTGDNPSTTYALGSTITLPGVGSLTCTKISGADTYTDKGLRKWIVTYEGSDATQTDPDNPTATTKYTLDIENNADGITVYTGTKEITCTGEAPTISTSVGGTFSVPYVGSLTCTRVHSSNDGNTWTVLIEGSRGGGSSSNPDDPDTPTPSMPENETVINYELNGITVRTVAGEFLALTRSQTPITKKSVTVYTNTVTAVASPGSTYEGGTVLSENIVKETIKSNGVVTGSYYKHTLEVEL